MQLEREYALTVAGFDTCSGAGLNADLKTFEQLKVYGLAVCTAYTLQTEDRFFELEWRDLKKIIRELKTMLHAYPVKAMKTGIIPGTDYLHAIVSTADEVDSKIKIVVDPVWKSSTGHTFNSNYSIDKDILKKITLVTPNAVEFQELKIEDSDGKDAGPATEFTAVLLKGGHNQKMKGTDILFEKKKEKHIEPTGITVFPKHGTGCILSAAITAELARGVKLDEACRTAKKYIEKYMHSNNSLLGFHAK